MDKKILIPVMFRPYDDELLESWAVRLAKANKMPMNYFRNTYFMEKLEIYHSTQSDPPYYLEGLFWLSRSVRGFPLPDELLLFHTLIPFSRGMGEDVMITARKTQAMLYNCGQEGYDVDYIHKPPMRKVCPQCMNEEPEKGMMPHLKVWHQVPGVRVCAIHKCRLLTMKKTYDIASLSQPDNDAIEQKDINYAADIYARYLRIRSSGYFKPVKEQNVNGLVLEKSDKVFLYARCSCCGTRFLTTVYAVEKGRLCPVCDRKTDVIGQQLKMIPGYTRVNKIRSISDTGVIRNKCGQTLAWRAGDIIWNGRRCGCKQ